MAIISCGTPESQMRLLPCLIVTRKPGAVPHRVRDDNRVFRKGSLFEIIRRPSAGARIEAFLRASATDWFVMSFLPRNSATNSVVSHRRSPRPPVPMYNIT